MAVIIQLFHPRLATSRVNRAWAEAASDAGFEVRDICGLYPDGNVDVEAEQAACERADALVFQHPLHWYGPPWLMKRWIDEVLSHGWAYGERYALDGKQWLSAVAVGGEIEEYRADGTRGYSVEEFLRPIERTAAFCHMQWRHPFLLYGSGYVDDAAVAASAGEYVRFLRKV